MISDCGRTLKHGALLIVNILSWALYVEIIIAWVCLFPVYMLKPRVPCDSIRGKQEVCIVRAEAS